MAGMETWVCTLMRLSAMSSRGRSVGMGVGLEASTPGGPFASMNDAVEGLIRLGSPGVSGRRTRSGEEHGLVLQHDPHRGGH